MNLVCPKCKHEWDFKGKSKRVECPNCKKFFRTEYKPAKKPANEIKPADKSCQLSVDLMRGNVVDALKKIGLDPENMA